MMSHSWSVLIVVMFVGCSAASTPATVGPATASSTKVASTTDASGVSAADSRKALRKLEEIKVLTCLELAEAIKKDSKLTEYRNVILQVTDIVSDFEPTNGLLICSYGPQLTDRCYFYIDRQQPEFWGWITAGQRVTLRGRTPGPAGVGAVWEIVDFGPNPAPIVAARALAEEFANDGILAAQRYDNQPVYVTGEVLKITLDACPSIILKGKEQLNVALYCPFQHTTIEKTVHVGQMISAVGRLFDRFDPLTNEVPLHFSAPISIPFPVPDVRYAKSMDVRRQERIQNMKNSTAEFKLDINELIKEIQQDKQAANSKYSRKCAELTGTVKDFSSGRSGDTIRFSLGDGFSDIRCDLLELEPWRSYSPTQRLTVRGYISNMNLGPVALEDGVVISTEELARPFEIFNADELISRYSKDPFAFREQWRDKRFEVVGTVESLDEEMNGFRLKGSDGISIHCKLPASEQKSPYTARFFRHSVGDQVQAKVVFEQFHSNDNIISLAEAWEKHSPQGTQRNAE